MQYRDYYHRAMSSSNLSFMQHAVLLLVENQYPSKKVERLMERIEFLQRHPSPEERFREIMSYEQGV